MKLNVHERMVLIPLLPTEEDYAGMSEIMTLKLTLQMTGEEASEMVMKDAQGNQVLNTVKAAAHVREIPVSEWMMKTIRKILADRDKRHKIKENELTLFKKFVLDYEQK